MIRLLRWGKLLTLISVLLVGVATAAAQTAGPYAITRFVIGTGGVTGSIGGAFGLNGTAGQPFTGGGSGGSFSLTAGFQVPRSSGSSPSNTVYLPAGVMRYSSGW